MASRIVSYDLIVKYHLSQLVIFKIFSIDEESFVDDFRAIDTDGDGQITLDNLIEYIYTKTKSNKHWSMFLRNPQIIDLAHQAACMEFSESTVQPISDQSRRVVKVDQFRLLLMHLYVNSILWTHFENATRCVKSGNANGKLGFQEFKLACMTLSHSRGLPAPTDEQLMLDFKLIDGRGLNSVSFTEVM